MPTFTAFTTLLDEPKAQALAEAMENMTPEPYGVGVFQDQDDNDVREVGGYFHQEPDQASLSLLAAAFAAPPFVVAKLPETDWVAKVRRDLPPVVAGRFFLYGSHDAHNLPTGVVPLLVDAALAFGTGHHGTTLGCLQALDHLAHAGFVGRTVVDIGCGTAVLAMAAAKIWPGHTVLASDIDAIAVKTAAANVGLNDLSGRVHCLQSAGFDHTDITASAPFDLVFANILKSPLIALAPDMEKHLASGGYVILSGILNTQAAEITEVYAAHGFEVHRVLENGAWTTLTLYPS